MRTPLAALEDHGFVGAPLFHKNLIFGNIQGTIGETSVIAILIGAAILLFAFKVIIARIPLTYIGSFAVFVIFYMLGSGKGFDVNYLFSHLLAVV